MRRCWCLCSVLVVVCLMTLVWMFAMAVIFLVEKNWRYGVALTRVAGVALVCLGVAVAVAPSLLPRIAGGG